MEDFASLRLGAMVLGCPDCPPPPLFDLREPPDPSAFFQELGIEWGGYSGDCPLGLGGLAVGDWASTGGPYLGFLIAASALLVLLSLTATLVVLAIRRRRLSLEAKARGGSLGSSGFHVADEIRSASLAGSEAKRTQWAYAGLRTPTRSNFGVLMYGDGSQRGTESVRSLHHSQASLNARRPETLAYATQGRRRPLMGLQAIPAVHPPPPPPQPLYEEIRLEGAPPVRGNSLDELLGEERRRRLPPPSMAPPPPPLMVDMAGSPLSAASCSCSATSNSLDQEMDGLRVTPSPRQRHADSFENASAGSSGGSGKELCGGGRESGYGTERRRPTPLEARHQIRAPPAKEPHSMTYV